MKKNKIKERGEREITFFFVGKIYIKWKRVANL